MALIVQKYGGSSVATLDRVDQVSEKIIRTKQKGHDVIVVVSAMYGETDRLIQLAYTLTPHPNPRDYDVLVSTGEQVAMALLSIALNAKHCSARCFTSTQIGLYTDNRHTKAGILRVDATRVHRELEQGNIVIVAGFQGVSEAGDITTLGRGGSDATAVAVAIAIQADECQIYTDVDGVYTTDPHFLAEARLLSQISFTEMLEMASLGSKVLQMGSVQLASKHRVPIRVLSTFSNGEGTLVLSEDGMIQKHPISGIAFSREEAIVSLIDIPYQVGVEGCIINAVLGADIELDMFTQQLTAHQKTCLSFIIPRREYLKIERIIAGLFPKLGHFVINFNLKVAKLSIVGIGIRSYTDVMYKIFTTLDKVHIPILMLSTSEIKISMIIHEIHLERSVRSLHTVLGLDKSLVDDERKA